MKNWFRKFLSGLFLTIFLLLVVVLLGEAGIIDRIEDSTLDMRYQIANPKNRFSDKLVVLDIDENSLSTYAQNPLFGRWPWSRKVYPPILQYLYEAGARLVLFDILFFEETSEDEGLVLSTLALENVSHAITISRENLTPEEEKAIQFSIPENILYQSLKVDTQSDSEFPKNNVLRFPKAGFLKEGRKVILSDFMPLSHVVSYNPDSDGVARKAYPLFRYLDSFYPSLTIQAYNHLYPIENFRKEKNVLIFERQDGESLNLPLTREGKYRLHYYDRDTLENLNRIGISSVIDTIRALEAGEIRSDEEGKAPKRKFQDKIVIIGTSASAAYDTILTPLGPRPGFTYHAVFLSNLIEKHILQPPPKNLWVVLLLILIPACVYTVLFFRNIGIRIFLPACVLFGYPFVCFFAFQWNVHFPLAEFLVSYPLAFVGSLIYLTLVEGAEQRKYSRILRNMVDPAIVSEALKDLEGLKRGGEWEITAFFSDVAGFSSISEKLNSRDLAALLNEYLSVMTVILKDNKGTLDKYIGDAIVGIFGAPVQSPFHYLEACRASLEMIRRLAELKQFWKENQLYIPEAWEIRIRIGLNTGVAKVGFMGTDSIASYTMMGDTVNLAARLEAAAKDYGVEILISEFTQSQVAGEFFTRRLDRIRVAGKSQPVNIYELVSFETEVLENRRASAELYEEGFWLYQNREWEKAIAKFEESKQARGESDKAANLLIERCTFFAKNPPEKSWDGVFTRDYK